MYRSILVPLDGSGFGEDAIPVALRLAEQAGGRVHLVHVHVAPSLVYGDAAVAVDNQIEEALRWHERAYLENLADALKKSSDVPVETSLIGGDIIEGLESQIAEDDVDLVVMTSHGRGRLARFFLGSFADELVRKSSVPVLFVRAGEAMAYPTPHPGFRRIMIPLDGSSLAEEILEPATAVNIPGESVYLLLRIIRPMVLGNVDNLDMVSDQIGPVVMKGLEATFTEECKAAEDYLASVAVRMKKQGLRVETAWIAHEDPSAAILDAIKDHDIDLMAIATHGRSGFRRLILGSVADKLLRCADIPVLVHRPS